MRLSINAIEKQMAQKGLTQGALAKRCSFSQPWLCKLMMKIKAGEDIKPIAVNRLAKGLEVKIEELILEEDKAA